MGGKVSKKASAAAGRNVSRGGGTTATGNARRNTTAGGRTSAGRNVTR